MQNIKEILSKMTKSQIKDFLSSLTEEDALLLLNDWTVWQMKHQRWPSGKWRRWICRAGRGSGKSYMGSRWTNEIARNIENISGGEIGIIARTWTDARQTCIEGPSGILKTAPSDFVPLWEPGKGTLLWPNGVRGRIFSADKPESLRGNNWAWVWADEVCFWQNPEKTWWESIEPALRMGIAQALITTTPLPDKFLRELEEKSDTIVTRASTYDNKFLKSSVLNTFKDHYEGTRRGKQELYGEFLDANPNALWSYDLLRTCYRDPTYFDFSKLSKIVVAIDPAVTSNKDSDESGIIVAGVDKDGTGYILEDRTIQDKPDKVCEAAIEAYYDWEANFIVAEVNNGGDWIESNIRLIDSSVKYKKIHAKRGKFLRAEPVHTAYERKKVFHVGRFPDLELQQTEWEPGDPDSPDRLDAAVYALTELLVLEPPVIRDFKKIGSAMKTWTVRS